MQEQGLLQGGGRLGRGGTRIVREQRALPPLLEGPAEAAHRAWWELQPLGNDGGRMPLLPESEEALTVRERQGCRHGRLRTPSEGWK
jgi:hypothetical protein